MLSSTLLILILIPALFALVAGHAARTWEATMDLVMQGGMMWGMRLVWVLVVIALILAIAALVKYPFSGGKR